MSGTEIQAALDAQIEAQYGVKSYRAMRGGDVSPSDEYIVYARQNNAPTLSRNGNVIGRTDQWQVAYYFPASFSLRPQGRERMEGLTLAVKSALESLGFSVTYYDGDLDSDGTRLSIGYDCQKNEYGGA